MFSGPTSRAVSRLKEEKEEDDEISDFHTCSSDAGALQKHSKLSKKP